MRMPFRGAKKKEKIAMIERTITIQGPVGMEGAAYEINAPATPENAPNNAARMIILSKSWVQNRDAAAGVISIAAVSTTPTA